MKRIYSFFSLLFASSALLAQTYNMSSTTVSTCSGTFYDSGGQFGSYSYNESFLMTFNSSTGDRLRFTFTSFSVETCCDQLRIYDGPSSGYPQIGTFTSNPGVIESTGSSITFYFSSDFQNHYSGWAATITCTTPAITPIFNMTAGTVTACSGTFNDNGGPTANYTDLADITETFCSGTSDHLQFTFWQGATEIQSGDTLFVYDGASTAAPLLAIYTLNSIIESFTGSGTCITFRFKSNASGNGRGWAGWFQCVSGTPPAPDYWMSSGLRVTCGGNFYDSGGPTGSYLNYENKTMSFKSANGNRLSVTFSGVSLETCCDVLYVFDGPSTAYPLLATVSGPATFTSTGQYLTFLFSSNASTQYSGWAASFSCAGPPLTGYSMSTGTVTACSGVFYDAGGPAAAYANNQNITQTFCSGTSDYLQFTFMQQATYLQSGDTLFAYDGASIASPLLAAYTTNSNFDPITSTGSCLTFRFKSDGTLNANGWAAEFACVSTPASPPLISMSSGIRATCGGYFYDSGGSGNFYSGGENRNMILQSANGNRISLNFTVFSVEPTNDLLYIYDGPSAAYPLIGAFSGSNMPGTVTSSGNALYIRFTSNGLYNYQGWEATISCTTPVLPVYSMSTGTVTACSGVFYDSGGPTGSYSANQNIVQTFCSGTSDHLLFTFLSSGQIYTGDTLFVYDGATTASPLLAAYTLFSNFEALTSSGTCLTFRFKSDGTNNYPGWSAVFGCTTTPPGTGFFNISGGIHGTCFAGFYDTGGSTSDYSNYENQTTAFQSVNGNRVSANFSSFSLASGDYLYVYDGPSAAYPLIGMYQNNPGTVTSTGTALCFRFTSDGSNVSTGWAATISCTTPPLTGYTMSTGTITACSGMYYDNGGSSGDYLNNSNMVQTICSGTGDFLQFTFMPLATNIQQNDTLFVYDGASTASPLIGAYTALGYMLPSANIESFTSTGTCVTFRLKSDATSSQSGWAASFTCTTTPGAPPVFNMSSGIRAACGGTFYDSGGNLGGYSNSESRQMTLQSNNGNRISLTFTSFALEPNLDILYIFDGPSSAYPLIGSFSATSPGTITSAGTSLTIAFSSNSSNSNTGWAATISCTTPALPSYVLSNGTVTTCGGRIYDSGGPFANYADNQNITQTFCSGTGDHLAFSFYSTSNTLSNSDTLFIYDGANTSAPLLAIHVAGSNFEHFISSGTCITLRFKSNSSVNSAGWAGWFDCTTSGPIPESYSMSAGVRYVCSGTFYDAGGPSANYPNYQYNSQTFASNNGQRVSMTFNFLSTETCCDILYIYDGPSTSYPLLGAYSSNPGTVTSSGTALTIFFNNSNTVSSSGWSAAISCAGPALPSYTMSTGTVTLCGGVFYDSGGPTAAYGNLENRVQTFTSSTGQYLKFDFNPLHYNIATGDSLFVYDGPSTSSPLYAIFTGTMPPAAITSNTSSFTFRFRSDAGTTNIGWQALISCVSAPDNNPAIPMYSGARATCGGTFYDAGGQNANYPDGENRVMTFYSNSGCGIRFTFTSFNTQTTNDVLYVFNGPGTTYPLIGTYSGGALPPQIQSTGNALTFWFQSNFSINSTGWSAIIDCPNQPLATIIPNGSTNLCAGDSVTLTVAPNTSYLWNTGATTQSITVHNSGSYWVNVVNASGCTAVSPVTVVNVNTPVVPTVAAGGPTTFCQGGSVVLNTSAGGTLLWSNTATTSSITVTQSGNYTVTSTDGNGCTATSAPIAVTVNPTPSPAISASGPVNICQGDSVILVSSGSGSFLWSNGSTNDSIVVYASGTFSVSVTNGFGCTGNSTPVSVSVAPYPVAGITAGGPTTFCQGGSVQLIGSGSGAYLWNTGATTASIFPTSSGTYYLTVTGGNGCADTSPSIVVTVNPTPSPGITASGPLSFCAGDSVTLTASGGGPYLWSNGSTAASITVSQSGTYDVSVTNGFGCTGTATPVTVTVNSIPVAAVSAGGPTTFCQGGSVQLNATGGSAFLWNNSNTGSSITVTQPGTYYVIASNGPCSDTSSGITVTVNSLPNVTLVLPMDTFCNTLAPVALSGGSPAGGSYSGTGVSSGQFSPAVAGTGFHTITYTFTDSNSCSNTAQQLVFVDNCSSVQPVETALFQVTPNPAHDRVTVQFGTAVFESVRILDITGRLLYAEAVKGRRQLTLPLQSLAPGVYLLQAEGAERITVRLVKE